MLFLVCLFALTKLQGERFLLYTQLLKSLTIFPACGFQTRCLWQDNDPCLRCSCPSNEFFENDRLLKVSRTTDCHESCHRFTCVRKYVASIIENFATETRSCRDFLKEFLRVFVTLWQAFILHTCI